jgi:hypothetical protein
VDAGGDEGAGSEDLSTWDGDFLPLQECYLFYQPSIYPEGPLNCDGAARGFDILQREEPLRIFVLDALKPVIR